MDLHELKEVLAELYMADGQRERALSIYLQLQRPGLFDFIHLVQAHHLLLILPYFVELLSILYTSTFTMACMHLYLSRICHHLLLPARLIHINS